MELVCKIQNYEWGKIGSQSKVALLFKNANEDFTIDESKPYAELWMGTHVNGPSCERNTGQPLSEIIAKHPEYLGEKVAKDFNKELPFLFKVLSVNKALSIQAHPSKKHAEELHAKFPDVYKDPNHKPEMAVALTPFEALCGFRPTCEIHRFIEDIPALKKLLSDCLSLQNHEEFLKNSFRKVLTTDKVTMKTTIEELISWLRKLDDNDQKKYLAELVQRLDSQFPNDNGIIMVYFLNYLKLEPSQALYLEANDPHAYLSGDCMEIMACSDNVVRAGLTPKFVDVDTLCSMLIYKGQQPKDKLFQPIKENEHISLFKPPVKDFALVEIRLPSSTREYKVAPRDSASIILVVEGRVKTNISDLKAGSVLFLPANNVLHIREVSEDVLLYQGLANVF
ncbi:unnamed protein product [Acanthoscelides obtectus]|uniref:Mannose-6-phosphate isomerase n=1 Tax=Acanthoscelides obtectus TaxID=200917 RepID=A0A9P0KX21_ACAOB|nr:unnamed protein product [Acanthoscelides obtectus]CAK1637780.1 Mannose-6-phosphate isomerase [Acanthoscelides obtectus]